MSLIKFQHESKHNMTWLDSYACSTAAGDGAEAMMSALRAGVSLASPASESLPFPFFQFTDRAAQSTVRKLLGHKLLHCFGSVQPALNGRVGVILASTKGFSNDFVWSQNSADAALDPLTPLLDDFVASVGINFERSICVSNACSSTLAALALAQLWLSRDLDQVLVLVADAVTPFVGRGFQALRLISPDGSRPFAADRNGFYLGDAAACLLLSRKPGAFRLYPIGLDTESSAVTRPSSSGESLVRAARNIPGLVKPDAIIAHGTGTPINDATEDLAFQNLNFTSARVTSSKWCIGHTLGASAALDLIAACESLRTQNLFGLATTRVLDPHLKCNFQRQTEELKLNRIMVSSLGFGGMHASALVERK